MCIKNYQTLKITADFKVNIVPPQANIELSDADSAEIEAIWEREKKLKGDQLFNGLLLNHTAHDESQLTGYFIEYKHYLAQLHNPALFKTLKIEGVGITGLTTAGDFVLFGKRAAFVATHPLFYELAPAGGLDPSFVRGEQIPLSIPFIREIDEEVGIWQDKILSIDPFTLVHDSASHLYEICAEVVLDPNILEKTLNPSTEYEAICWVPRRDLAHFIATHKQTIVPLSLFLLS